MHPEISIVVPVHNEAGFIESALPRLLAAAEPSTNSFEVIVAENGSTDGTADIASGFASDDDRVSLIRLNDADYGAAMRAGFLAARGSWVVNFDIDYFSGEFLASGLGSAETADVILGSKRATGSEDRRSVFRRMGTWGFNLLLRALFRSRVSDTHGIKMVRRAVIERIVPAVHSTRDLFDTELVLRAERSGYRIAEIPVVVEELRTARTGFIGRIPRTLVGLWRIRRALHREAKANG